MTPTVEQDRETLAIYVAASRDIVDALDMIIECKDVLVLDTLLQMLRHPGGPDTDRELNEIMVGPVERRLATLRSKA